MGDIIIAGYPPDEPFQRGEDETTEEYRAFVEWCRIPISSRTVPNFCGRTGLNQSWVSKVRKGREWDARVAAFDAACEQLRPSPLDGAEEASKAAQLAAAEMLTEVGSIALGLKNPAHLTVDQSLKLIEKGTEIRRRALGEADVTIDVKQGSLERVGGMFDEMMELEAESVEIVREDNDGSVQQEGAVDGNDAGPAEPD